MRSSLAVILLVIASAGIAACGQRGAVPSGGAPSLASRAVSLGARPADTTSILKKLTKDVVIGTTVDPSNGDTGPRSLAMAVENYGEVKKGDLLVCNFADSAGTAGNGTTVELLPSKAGSSPTTFYQGSAVEGCDGSAVVPANDVYASGFTSKKVAKISQTGTLMKTYGSPIVDPLADSYGKVPPGSAGLYSAYYVFVGDAQTGSIVDFDLGQFGDGKDRQVVSGFDVNKGSGWGALGPAGFAYNNKKGTLYVTDGACNAVVAIEKAPNLLEKNEIVVGSHCKSFVCKAKKFTCATLLKAGSPLNKPEGATLLPNGNLIVANTGNNALVEMTPTGQVLDTKVIDTGSAPAIFGLWAIGTNDTNTALFFTDTNANNVQELEQ